mmetsp:Transcript_34990/g.87551  ORF Transcript_34990/g.87551 Transcript_34990/m.87551 type:complete len:220 (+) Transcript_34990:425-1084(+)
MAAMMAAVCSADSAAPPSVNDGGPVRSASTSACIPASMNTCTMAVSTPRPVALKAPSRPWNLSHPPAVSRMHPRDWKAAVPASPALLGAGRPKYALDTSPPSSTSDATTGTPSSLHAATSTAPWAVSAASAGSDTDAGVSPAACAAMRLAEPALPPSDTLPTFSVALRALMHSTTPSTASSHQHIITWSSISTPSSAHCMSTHSAAPSAALLPLNTFGM